MCQYVCVCVSMRVSKALKHISDTVAVGDMLLHVTTLTQLHTVLLQM